MSDDTRNLDARGVTDRLVEFRGRKRPSLRLALGIGHVGVCGCRRATSRLDDPWSGCRQRAMRVDRVEDECTEQWADEGARADKNSATGAPPANSLLPDWEAPSTRTDAHSCWSVPKASFELKRRSTRSRRPFPEDASRRYICRLAPLHNALSAGVIRKNSNDVSNFDIEPHVE